MLWRKLRGRYTRRMEDPQKVQDKIIELNKNSKVGKWLAVEGYQALIDVRWKDGDEITFNLDQGYTLKVFVNNVTGEVKMFAAELFRRDT